jgi:hypothetical protein
MSHELLTQIGILRSRMTDFNRKILDSRKLTSAGPAHRRSVPPPRRPAIFTPIKAPIIFSSDDDEESASSQSTEALVLSDDSHSNIAQKTRLFTIDTKSASPRRPLKKKSRRMTSPVSIYFSAEGSALLGDSDEVKDLRAMLESSDNEDELTPDLRAGQQAVDDGLDDF